MLILGPVRDLVSTLILENFEGNGTPIRMLFIPKLVFIPSAKYLSICI